LTFGDASQRGPQIEEDLRQAVALKADFAEANGLLAVYLLTNNEKLPEALTFVQKAISLEPRNVRFQFARAQVLLRMRRYYDAEAIGHSLRASAIDDTAREQADEILTDVAQARDYEARMRQMRDEEAARAAARASESGSAARAPRASRETMRRPPKNSRAQMGHRSMARHRCSSVAEGRTKWLASSSR